MYKSKKNKNKRRNKSKMGSVGTSNPPPTPSTAPKPVTPILNPQKVRLYGSGGGVGVYLYVKAGVDGERMGACPFCQRVFMVLMAKANRGAIKFKVREEHAPKIP